MSASANRRHRAGFTLLETVVAIALLLAVFGIAVPFFQTQVRAVSAHEGRMESLRNARYAVTTIDRDLRVAGSGVVDEQPVMVYAHPYAMAFNVDLATRVTSDAGAVYYDPDADSSSTIVLPKERQITLPYSGTLYPDTTYFGATGFPSRAETVQYWVDLDYATPRTDDYRLWRRVNDAPASMVSRGIILSSGEPMFRYYRDSLGRMVEIPQAKLPLTHTTLHDSPADTAGSALTDSVRVVRVKVSALYDDPRQGPVIRSVEHHIGVLNSGLLNASTCGKGPGAPVSVVAALHGGPPWRVQLTWTKSPDEDTGERDVTLYFLVRRPVGQPLFGEPFASVPSGLVSPTYDYFDDDPPPGKWIYGIVAQDCTPKNSAVTTVGPIDVPEP